jgi:hypothetical protein
MQIYNPFKPKPPLVSVIRLQGVIASGSRGLGSGEAGLSDAGLATIIQRAFTRGKPKAVVATRIILIQGLQPENSGTNSVKDRNIYFHGTNVEELIGRPASGGCIRMRNSDVIKLFDMVTVGDVVYVMGRSPSDNPPLPSPSIDAVLSMGRYKGAAGRTVGMGTVDAPRQNS